MSGERTPGENPTAVITVHGEAKPEGFLEVSGWIGSRAHLAKAIDALHKAADALWPRRPLAVVRRVVTAEAFGDPPPGRSALDQRKRGES